MNQFLSVMDMMRAMMTMKGRVKLKARLVLHWATLLQEKGMDPLTKKGNQKMIHQVLSLIPGN